MLPPEYYWHWLLRAGCTLSLLGLCLAHWCGDQPYRAIAWDETLMTPVLALFDISWQDWVTDTDYSNGIDTLTWSMGLVFALLIPLCFVPGTETRWRWLPVVCMLPPLLLLGWARWAEHHYDLLWPPEFCLRLSLPLLLFSLNRQPIAPVHLRLLLIACGLTFIGHGTYALGWYPTPLAFHQMIQDILPLSDSTCTAVLYLIGIIDVLVGLLLFAAPLRQPVLLWMSTWGLLTATMRLHAIDWTFLDETLWPALAAWLERLPHVVVPLLCWHWIVTRQQHAAQQTMPQPDGNANHETD